MPFPARWSPGGLGRPLVRLGADRYAREADFRFALVQGSERAEGIALSNGEADSLRGLEASLGTLVAVLRQIAFARMRLTWVTAGYGWVALVFPIAVAAPGYFAGRLSFGELMMVVGAFNQVQQSLRWFVDNTGAIADWRATLLRVMNFRQALLELDAVEAGAGLIERSEDPQGRFRLDAVRVETGHGSTSPRAAAPRGRAGRARAHPRQAELGADELFPCDRRALERGVGPDQRAAGRRGRLPDAAALPAVGHAAGGAHRGRRRARGRGAARRLGRVGLDSLAGSLDTAARWDRELGLGEQERLSYARLLLERPKWLICDEGLDPVDEASREALLSILADELAESAVVNISQRREPKDFYGRTAELVASRAGSG